MSIEIMRQALEALEGLSEPYYVLKAQDALRTAIEHYDQTSLELCEECGWRAMIPGDGCLVCARQKAPRQWVELTDDEARDLVNRATFGDRTNWQAFVYMVDAKLKEKNAA